MRSERGHRKIGEVAKIKGGKRMPTGTSLTPEKTAHPYLRIVDFRSGGIDSSSLLYVPDDVFPRISRYTISTNDIYISIVGTIGLIGQIPLSLDGASLTENAAKITEIDTQAVVPAYLRYFLSSDESQEKIRSQTVGSTQPKLALYRIEEIEFPLPSLAEQRAIAETLGALDDRIDNLRQTNATLEAIAAALFKSWFVDFDGVPQEDMQESELGLIPKEWQAGTLGTMFEINPKRELKKDTVAPYLDMASVPTADAVPDAPVMRGFSSGTKFINGDTLLARITPCLENGKTAFVAFLDDGQTGWGSTEFIVLRPKPPMPPFFGYLLARREDFRTHAIRAMSGTSGRQRVEVGQLQNFKLAIPDEATAKAFAAFVEPLQQSIFQNAKQAAALATLRDTLLPHLISGRLRVAGATNSAENGQGTRSGA